MSSEYVFVGNSIDRFVEAITRVTQLWKLSVKVPNGLSTCKPLIYLFSVSSNPNFLYKNKEIETWFQIAAMVWFLSLILSKTKFYAGI